MKKLLLAASVSAMCLFSLPAQAMFSGDTKLACEAVLCLSSGNRPSECNESIRKYYSISMKKAWKTARARKNFLDLCPAADPAVTAAIMNQNPAEDDESDSE